MSQMKLTWPLGVAALCLWAGAAGAAERAMSKEAFEAAQQRIEAEAKTDRQACRKLEGNARDVCQAQAKGREQARRAELEARYKQDPEAERAAKEVTADANYKVAKKKCQPAKGKARDQCLRQAKAAREAAIRQAKVEKVERINALKADAEEQRKPARAKS
jgi:hypothetical protein